jgi:hypothetical protein
MSRLALGTVQFGLPYGVANQDGQVSRKAAKVMLQQAAANGIDILDTAIAYGESETCLGEVGVQEFKLVTKIPEVPNDCADVGAWVQEQAAESFARLGVKSAYGLLLHRSMQLLDKDGKLLYRALQELKEAGLVQKIGVSIYSPDELEVLVPNYRFDLVQAPFNLVDRRLHTTGWLRRLKLEGVEIHARSAFLQGLLLMKRAEIPSRFDHWNELWNSWHNWQELHSISAIQACLAYPLSFSEIDRVVVGADSSSQFEQIITASRLAIPGDLPDLHCEDENLINPACWSKL